MTAAAPFRRYRVRVATPAGAALLDAVLLARGLDDAGLRGLDMAREALTVAVELLPETRPEAGPVPAESPALLLPAARGDDLAPLSALDWIAMAARGKEGS